MDIINSTPYISNTYQYLLKYFENDASNDCIVLFPYSLTTPIEVLKSNYDKVILFNQEQIGSPWFTDEYIDKLKKADEVWDYDEYNIEHLKYIREDIKLHCLKPFIVIPEQDKEYDVLFYGSWNSRREKILNELLNAGVNVKIIDGVFGDDLNDYIAKSKCLLNIHYYDACLQEQDRLIRWVGNGKIFSEKSRTNYLNIDEYEYDELVPSIIGYLSK